MIRKILITGIIILLTGINIQAESLFTLGASQHYYASPQPLFGGVKARNIGDLVSIILDESVLTTDSMSYSTERSSNTVDNFTTFLSDLFHIGWIKEHSPNNFGGENTVESSVNTGRNMRFGNTIAAQVVQVQGNGNLMVQGKKTLVSGNERMDLIVTGVVDPRWINQKGEVYSKNVANLQFALNGRGTVSRGQNEGIINRFIRYLF